MPGDAGCLGRLGEAGPLVTAAPGRMGGLSGLQSGDEGRFTKAGREDERTASSGTSQV